MSYVIFVIPHKRICIPYGKSGREVRPEIFEQQVSVEQLGTLKRNFSNLFIYPFFVFPSCYQIEQPPHLGYFFTLFCHFGGKIETECVTFLGTQNDSLIFLQYYLELETLLIPDHELF